LFWLPNFQASLPREQSRTAKSTQAARNPSLPQGLGCENASSNRAAIGRCDNSRSGALLKLRHYQRGEI
jgi:hypothetical protein